MKECDNENERKRTCIEVLKQTGLKQIALKIK